MNHETRITGSVDVRMVEAGGVPKLVGYAAKFGTRSQDLGGFTETIRAGAFARAISEKQDVRALINHDPNQVLGRSTSGTLTMSEDANGLLVEITPPDTRYAADLLTLIKRGDINQMSFAFKTVTDDWRMVDGLPQRELVDVNLYDVSPVTYPAYADTSIASRALASWQEASKPAPVIFDMGRINRQKIALMK